MDFFIIFRSLLYYIYFRIFNDFFSPRTVGGEWSSSAYTYNIGKREGEVAKCVCKEGERERQRERY